MLIYGLNLAVIGLLYFLIYHSRTSRIHFLRLTLLYLFVISSLRSKEIGADYPVYVQTFYSIMTWGSSYMEKGYVLLNKIVAFFTHQYIGLALAVNTLIFVPLYYYIKNQTSPKYWPLCVFVFAANPYMFIQTTFNALRQGCATGIILIGMNFLLREEKKRISLFIYFITVLVAAQFHRVAYVMLLVPIILTFKWEKIYWLALTAAAVLLNLIGSRIIASIVAAKLHYTGYLNYSASLLNNPVYVVFVVIVIMFLLSHYDSYAVMKKREKRLVDFYLFSLVFLILALPNDMYYRVYMILSFCALPGIPVICESTKVCFSKIRIRHEEYYVRRLYFFYYLFFYIGYITLLAVKTNSAYVPFKFFFS